MTALYDKLKKYNINIKTKYIVGNKILEKNTKKTESKEKAPVDKKTSTRKTTKKVEA